MADHFAQNDEELGFQPQNPGQTGNESQEKSKHPTAIFFHIFFKAAAALTYLFCSIFTSNFILVFVTCVILLACDFWTVKNVTGRLLVGLRWWNEVLEDGTNQWRFESKPENRKIHPFDSMVFWTALYLTPLIWLFFAIGALAGLKFQWLLVVAVALVLSGANLIGYWKCQKDAKSKIQSFIAARL